MCEREREGKEEDRLRRKEGEERQVEWNAFSEILNIGIPLRKASSAPTHLTAD